MTASVASWLVVVVGMAVVIGAVLAAVVAVARVARSPDPSRPRVRRASGTLAPPGTSEDDPLASWDDQIDADGEWHS